jgi:hypothetical protein
MPIIPATWEEEAEGSMSKTGLGKSSRPYPKNRLKAKKTGFVVQVVEHLPSKYMALSSISSNAKEKRIFIF